MQIDYNLLKTRCLSPIKAFKAYGNVTKTQDGIYISNCHTSNKVLAVAHLDSVLNLKHFYVNHIGKQDYIFNAQLDDRLGAYILIDLLPSMGLKYDILLTEGEEQGRSTGFYFGDDKQYNWMFSFDRRGDDVVMYQYDNSESRTLLKPYGFHMGIGSFSDIAFMEHLNCTGFNFGSGYYNEHSPLCHMSVKDTLSQVSKFVTFFRDHKNTYMPYTPQPTKSFYKAYSPYMIPDSWDDGYTGRPVCEFCNSVITKDDVNYECCNECAIEFGVHCEICGVRISVNDMERSGLCNKCEDSYIRGKR